MPTTQSLLYQSKEEAWNHLDDFEKASVDPKKAKEEFRNYKDSDRQDTVENHYRMMRTNQTVAFVDKMYKKYHSFDKKQMTIWEAFEVLGGYVDASDPDTELPNIEHGFQTAEAIRAAGHPDWFQLVGLIHDLGKMMFLWGTPEDGQIGKADGPQWALGGDTWVVGHPIPDTCVFSEFNALNTDMQDSRFNAGYGVYKAKCGLDNLRFAYGHDEYLYQMLVFNKDKVSLPKPGLAMIRYHSCYPLHSKGSYDHLLNEKGGDMEALKWVREFNKFDLYTKSDKRPDLTELKKYYSKLIDKYMPGKLWW